MRAWFSFLVLIDCGHTCPVFTSPAFDITVTDGSGVDVCDANVTATSDKGASSPLSVFIDDASCSYGTSNSLPAGVYTLTVTAPGFMQATLDNQLVAKDDCGFDQTVTRTIVLSAP